MDVSHLLILSLAIIVSFPVCFYGNNQPQPAGKGIPCHCCEIGTVNFPTQSPTDLFCLSPGTISLCAPGAGQCSADPTTAESFVFGSRLTCPVQISQ